MPNPTSIGASFAEFAELSTDPPKPDANGFIIYAKDAAGVTHLFARDDAGTITDLMAASLTATAHAFYGGPTSGSATATFRAIEYSDISSLVREKRTSNLSLYVRTDGSDSNTGLANTAGGAVLTIQKAYDLLTANYDMGGKDCTIQIGDGTYTAGLNITQPWTGGGTVTIQGNSGTPSNVVISTTSSDCFAGNCPLPGNLTVKDLKVTAATSGSGLVFNSPGLFTYGNIDFGSCATFHILCAGSGARMNCASNYTISGGALAHWAVIIQSAVQCQNKTLTLSGTPAFSLNFAYADSSGLIYANGNTFSGSATGSRFNTSNGSLINSGSGGANYFPGNAAGTGTNYGTSPYGLYI